MTMCADDGSLSPEDEALFLAAEKAWVANGGFADWAVLSWVIEAVKPLIHTQATMAALEFCCRDNKVDELRAQLAAMTSERDDLDDMLREARG